MEQFTTTTTSQPCQCGGRHSRIPEVVTRHQNTKKHKTWEFQTLCLEFLKVETLKEKKRLLLQKRDLVRTGLVW